MTKSYLNKSYGRTKKSVKGFFGNFTKGLKNILNGSNRKSKSRRSKNRKTRRIKYRRH